MFACTLCFFYLKLKVHFFYAKLSIKLSIDLIIQLVTFTKQELVR